MQRGAPGVAGGQPRARVAKSDTCSLRRAELPIRLISDFDLQHGFTAGGHAVDPEPDTKRMAVVGHAMHHRILDQWLQQQRRYLLTLECRAATELMRQLPIQARALNAQVVARERQLLGQRHPFALGSDERTAIELAESEHKRSR